MHLSAPHVHHSSNNVEMVIPQGDFEARNLDPKVEDEDNVMPVGDTKPFIIMPGRCP